MMMTIIIGISVIIITIIIIIANLSSAAASITYKRGHTADPHPSHFLRPPAPRRQSCSDVQPERKAVPTTPGTVCCARGELKEVKRLYPLCQAFSSKP